MSSVVDARDGHDSVVVTIHQPEHLPWLGFFDKIRQSEVFVMLDHVQYRRRYFQNRNRIRGSEGPVWVAVPVKVKGKYDQPISEVCIDNEGSPRWREKCRHSIEHCYSKAACYGDHASFFEEVYRRKWDRLLDLNETIIRYLLSALGIKVEIVKSSALAVSSPKGELMLEICRAVGATTYVSGISGKNYLDAAQFAEHNIKLLFQEFHHPIYRQLYEPFTPCMSAVDLLFNHGPASLDILKGVGVKTLEHVFE